MHDLIIIKYEFTPTPTRSHLNASFLPVQWLSKVLTPWVGWGGVGSAEVADRALRLSRPDALMPSTAPGKARCAELFPPGARHLVTLGNVADRYTHPDDQPDPPETLQ